MATKKTPPKKNYDELFVMDPSDLPVSARAPYREMLLRLMQHEAIWRVVHQNVVADFQRNQHIAGYVRSKGLTDWVWLEEGLSGITTNDEQLQSEAFSRSDKRPDKHSASPRDAFETACYYAAFALSIAFIQSIWPQVRPPMWFEPIQAIIQNRTVVPAREAETLRDLLLEGRDAEALALLEFGRGARFYLHRQFWFDWRNERLKNRPMFVVDWSRDNDEASSMDEAIGKAVSIFLTHNNDTVSVKTLHLGDDDDRYDRDRVVFVIAASEDEIRRIVPDAIALRTGV